MATKKSKPKKKQLGGILSSVLGGALSGNKSKNGNKVKKKK